MFPQRHRFLGILILFPEWFLSIFLGEESIDKFTTWIRWSTFRTWVFCWRVLPIEEKFFTNWGWGSFPLFEPPFHSWKNPCQLKIYDLAFAAWPSQKHFWISFKINNSGINALLYQKREVQQFSSPSHIFTSGEQETWGAIDPPTELSCTTTRSKKKNEAFSKNPPREFFKNLQKSEASQFFWSCPQLPMPIKDGHRNPPFHSTKIHAAQELLKLLATWPRT